MKKLSFLPLALLTLTNLCALGSEAPRVAVLALEFGTVKSEAAAIFGTNVDLGKGIAALMVDELSKEKKFALHERAQIDKVLLEQDRGLSSRFDPKSAAEFGRILGVRAVIVGEVTKLGKENRGNPFRKTTEAVIGLAVRVVDSTSAKILCICLPGRLKKVLDNRCAIG